MDWILQLGDQSHQTLNFLSPYLLRQCLCGCGSCWDALLYLSSKWNLFFGCTKNVFFASNYSTFGIFHGIQAFFPCGSQCITEHGRGIRIWPFGLWTPLLDSLFSNEPYQIGLGFVDLHYGPRLTWPSPVFFLLSFYRKESADWSENFSCGFSHFIFHEYYHKKSPIDSEQRQKRAYDPKPWTSLSHLF